MKRISIGCVTLGCAVLAGVGIMEPPRMPQAEARTTALMTEAASSTPPGALSSLLASPSEESSSILSCASFAARLDSLYQWPLQQGMATFSARLTSPAIDELCRTQRVIEPDIRFEYLGWELADVEVLIATATPAIVREALAALAESVRNTAEGFFQNYETLGLRNPLHGLASEANCRFAGSRWTVSHPDRTPGQIITLEFDERLMLVSQTAEDTGKGLRIRQQPTWGQIDGRFVLTGCTIEFFQSGVSVFRSMTTIENDRVGAFLLPGKVRLDVRDGPADQAAGRAVIEFRCSDYRLGSAHR